MATSSRTLNSALLQDVGISVGSVNGANKKGSASFASVTFVLLNTALGSGILGLPGAFAKAGFIGGSVLLTLVAITSVVGVHLLVEVADRTGRPATFFTVAQAAAGAKAGILIDMLICMNAFGVSTSYLIVIGDAMPEVAGSFHGIPSALKERTVWILIGLAIGAPLAFLRNLSALRFTAYIAFVGVMYICVLVGLYAIAPLTSLKHELEPCANMTAPCHGDVVMLGEPLTALDSLPVFIFAFTCHQNAISITNEMVMPTPRRVAGAAASATALALGLYLIVGIGGYYTYGDLVKSDILVMYPDGSVMPVIGRLAIAFVVTTCYPMQLHPGRASLISLLHTFGPRRCLERMGGKEGTSLHVLATCFLVATTLGIALAVKKLGVILSVIGALCSTSVSFIVPGGAYVVVFHERGWSNPKRLAALGQLIMGLVIVPLCLTLTFLPQKKA